MSAKVNFSTDKRILRIQDELGVGTILLSLGYIFALALLTVGIMQMFEANSWWQHILGLVGSAGVSYWLMSTLLYRHKVWINSVNRTVRVQRRTGWLEVRTQEFAGSLFWGVRTREIPVSEDVEFEVELVNKGSTQVLKLARFNGKRMEKSFFQLPVSPGEPDEAVMLRHSVSLHLRVKDLGAAEA